MWGLVNYTEPLSLWLILDSAPYQWPHDTLISSHASSDLPCLTNRLFSNSVGMAYSRRLHHPFLSQATDKKLMFSQGTAPPSLAAKLHDLKNLRGCPWGPLEGMVKDILHSIRSLSAFSERLLCFLTLFSSLYKQWVSSNEKMCLVWHALHIALMLQTLPSLRVFLWGWTNLN